MTGSNMTLESGAMLAAKWLMPVDSLHRFLAKTGGRDTEPEDAVDRVEAGEDAELITSRNVSVVPPSNVPGRPARIGGYNQTGKPRC